MISSKPFASNFFCIILSCQEIVALCSPSGLKVRRCGVFTAGCASRSLGRHRSRGRRPRHWIRRALRTRLQLRLLSAWLQASYPRPVSWPVSGPRCASLVGHRTLHWDELGQCACIEPVGWVCRHSGHCQMYGLCQGVGVVCRAFSAISWSTTTSLIFFCFLFVADMTDPTDSEPGGEYVGSCLLAKKIDVLFVSTKTWLLVLTCCFSLQVSLALVCVDIGSTRWSTAHTAKLSDFDSINFAEHNDLSCSMPPDIYIAQQKSLSTHGTDFTSNDGDKKDLFTVGQCPRKSSQP